MSLKSRPPDDVVAGRYSGKNDLIASTEAAAAAASADRRCAVVVTFGFFQTRRESARGVPQTSFYGFPNDLIMLA